MRCLSSLPCQLLISIFSAFLIGRNIEASKVSLFYTASSFFIEILLFLLPLMIFCYIYLAITAAKQKSLFMMAFIFIAVTLSNSLALFTAYFFSSLVLPVIGIDTNPELLTRFNSSIEPLFKLDLPALFSTDKALFSAVLLGSVENIFMRDDVKIKPLLKAAIFQINRTVNFCLNKIFLPFLPLYVFGFCLKLSYDNALTFLFQAYGKVFIASMLLVLGYLFFLYFVGSYGNLNQTLNAIKKMLPAGLTGFSTMSSMATLPVTLRCVRETTKDTHLTDLTVPTSANIHMLGDDLTIVVTAMALLSMFGMPNPSFGQFVLFAGAFCIAKFSCVGVPSASVLVVLPVLQTFLGFTPEMIAVLTTIYVLQDPFGTAANVMGNGAFTLILQRVKNWAIAKVFPFAPR